MTIDFELANVIPKLFRGQLPGSLIAFPLCVCTVLVVYCHAFSLFLSLSLSSSLCPLAKGVDHTSSFSPTGCFTPRRMLVRPRHGDVISLLLLATDFTQKIFNLVSTARAGGVSLVIPAVKVSQAAASLPQMMHDDVGEGVDILCK